MDRTGDLVPADKKLYALRDVTATIENTSLIASSIMSKKIAAGADAIVLDVKTGNGAFMQTVDDSFALAKEMVNIGQKVGRKTTALITDMNQPLGMAIGNALEVKEAIEILIGLHHGALREVCITLASYMLQVGGQSNTVEEARELLEDALISGRGAEKLKEMIRAQGGDESIVNDPDRLINVKKIIPVLAKENGTISSIDAQVVGISAMLLGAGRAKKEDFIDPYVGIMMKKRIGDSVEKDEIIADFYVNDESKIDEVIKLFEEAITIGKGKIEKNPLVYGVVSENGVKRFI